MKAVQRTMTIGKGLWPLLRRLMSVSFFTIIIFVLFFNGIVESIEQKSFSPFLEEVGGAIGNTFQSIDDDSQTIASDKYQSFSFWKKLRLISNVVASLAVLWIWFKLFYWISAHMIVADTSRPQSNGLVAIGLLYITQIFFMFISSPDILEALVTPFWAFYHLGLAIPNIIEPIVNLAGKFKN